MKKPKPKFLTHIFILSAIAYLLLGMELSIKFYPERAKDKAKAWYMRVIEFAGNVYKQIK